MTDLTFYKCKTCGARQDRFGTPAISVCARFNITVTEDDFCKWHLKDLPQCNMCGRQILGNLTYLADHDIWICQDCEAQLYTCRTCANRECTYETDPSPLPKQIRRTVRQGNMMIQTPGRNPDREAITCQKGCHCYSPGQGCLRTNGACSQYQIHY